MKTDIPSRILFKEIEKKSWIFIICCVTMLAILGKKNDALGFVAGSLIVLYNYKILYLNLRKVFGSTDADNKFGRVGFLHFSRLLAVGILLYLSLAVWKVSVWGLVGGIVMVYGVIVYRSSRWFYEGGDF